MQTSSVILLTVASICAFVAFRNARGSVARRNYLRVAFCFAAIVAILTILQTWTL